MIGRIVITNVPRGLDGGTGFQPVLRTRGLRPSIAQRLVMRSAYPHPYPVGDPRNPHVVFHRIELVDGQTIHVLGSVRDAGASYTGRSNYLADLTAIDQAETGSLLGGPAYAAQSFPWIRAWTGEPRETPLAQEPIVAARDPDDPVATGRPAACPAWQRATGDAGWAGELAKSFVDGRRALIWAGDGSDVLELFAEALRLLPVQVRWQVTFNTCEIEAFPSHWRAVRPDLGLVGNYDPKNELRLVLGKLREAGSRAPDHEFSRRARGELIAAASPPSGGQTRVGDTGTPSGLTPPSGHAPADSATNDAVLREQLRHIRESRHRRSGIPPITDAAPSPYRSSVALFFNLLLGLLLVSAVAAVAVGTMAMRNPELFQGSTSVLLASSTPRTRTKEADQPATPATAVEDSPSQDGNGPGPSSPHPPTQPEPTPPRTADSARESVDQAQKACARENYAKLKGSQRILVPTRLSPEKSPEDIPLASIPEQKALPVAFVPEEFNPPLEVALYSPFDPSDGKHSQWKLKLVVEKCNTWVITGKPRSDAFASADGGSQSSNHRDEAICTVTITTGTLRVAPHLLKDNDLYTRLENSLLVLSAKNPDDPTEVTRCILPFSSNENPGTKTLGILRTGKSTHLAQSTSLLSEEVTRRTKGIPADAISYTLTCSHPSWDGEPKVVRKHFGSDPTPTISAKFPPKGITIKYHDAPSGTGAWVTHAGTLQISGTLMFSGTRDHPLSIESTFSFADTLSDCGRLRATITNPKWLDEIKNKRKEELARGFPKLFRNLFPERAWDRKPFDSFSENDRHLILAAFQSFAETRKNRAGEKEKLEVTFGALAKGGINSLGTPEKKEISTLEDLHSAQIQLYLERENTKQLGRNYNQPGGGMQTYDDKSEHESRVTAFVQADKYITNLFNTFRTFLDDQCTKDAKAIAQNFLLAKDDEAFADLSICVTDLRVRVFDSGGQSKEVVIVAPELSTTTSR